MPKPLTDVGEADSESAHQCALFKYVSIVHNRGWEIADRWSETGDLQGAIAVLGEGYRVDALEWFHSIPNGGSRGDTKKARMIRGATMKAEGVRAGVSDTFLPWPLYIGRDKYGDTTYLHGLYIEMKKPSVKPKTARGKGGMSEDQIAYKAYCLKNGYGFMQCYSWREAVDTLRDYITFKTKDSPN